MQTTFCLVLLGAILLCGALAQPQGPGRSRPPTERSRAPRPSPRPPVVTPTALPRPPVSSPRPPVSSPPPRPTQGTPQRPEPPTYPDTIERPVIDVGSPDEGCRSRRNDDNMLEICKVGTDLGCINETARSRLVLLCRTVDDEISGSGSGSDRARLHTAWLRNGEHISDDTEHFSVEARGTELHFVRGRIPGIYTCFVYNSDDPRQHDNASTTIKTTPFIRFSVNVMGTNDSCSRLRCPAPMVDTCPFTGETLLYHCSSSGSDPVIMTPSGPAPSAFVVNNCPRSAINGRYTCSSSNECGVRRETVNVRVFEPARIDRYSELPRSERGVMRLGAGRSREPVTVDVSSNVELHCPVYGTEDPRVGWFRQREGRLVRVRPGTCCRGVAITNVTTDYGISLILSIRNFSTNHYGRYVCRTNNRAGQDRGVVVLNEPGQWYAGEWSRCTRRRQVACYSADGERLLSRQQCSGRMPHEEESCLSYYDYFQDRNRSDGGFDRRDGGRNGLGFDRRNDRCERDGRDRFDRRDRFDERDRFDRRDRFDERDRFDRRDRFDERDRFDRRDRFDGRDRFDRRDRFDGRDRFDRRDRFDERDRRDRRDRNDDRCDGRDRFDGRDREGSCRREEERRCNQEERQRRREREGGEERQRRREAEEEMRRRERERDERNRDTGDNSTDAREFDRCPPPQRPGGMRPGMGPGGMQPEPPSMGPGGMRPGGMRPGMGPGGMQPEPPSMGPGGMRPGMGPGGMRPEPPSMGPGGMRPGGMRPDGMRY